MERNLIPVKREIKRLDLPPINLFLSPAATAIKPYFLQSIDLQRFQQATVYAKVLNCYAVVAERKIIDNQLLIGVGLLESVGGIAPYVNIEGEFAYRIMGGGTEETFQGSTGVNIWLILKQGATPNPAIPLNLIRFISIGVSATLRNF